MSTAPRRCLAVSTSVSDNNSVSCPENGTAEIETISARIHHNRRAHDFLKQINSAYRRRDAAALAVFGFNLDVLEAPPFADCVLTALRERIYADEHKLNTLAPQSARRAAAAQSTSGVTVEPWGDDVRITFAQEPERRIIAALKEARFFLCKGSWVGRLEQLPPHVAAMVVA